LLHFYINNILCLNHLVVCVLNETRIYAWFTRFYDTFISIIMSIPYPHEIDQIFVTIEHNIYKKKAKIISQYIYYIRLYFTVFLLARSNTRDIPFSDILISKKQFLCNIKSYCTLVQNQWMKLLSPSHLVTPIQYTKKKRQNLKKKANFQESYVIKQLLHLNLINMRFYGADSPRSILLYSFKCSNYIIMWSCPGNMPKYYPG
jgi:hypothetical protein